METTPFSSQQQPQKVQLGCGTLIIIALLIMFLSGDRSDRKLRREIKELRETIERLEKKVDRLQPPPATSTAP